MLDKRHWFATCPRGMESLLAAELRGLGAGEVRESVAGVAAHGPVEFGYRACLWSRLANRVLLVLHEAPAENGEDLYRAAGALDWTAHFDPGARIAVDFTGTWGDIRHTVFGAQRVKDAVVDHFRAAAGTRPTVDVANPDMRINARLHRGRVTLSLDFSGSSLHRRGYRERQLSAPLKENLAAALLLRSGWPEVAAAGGELLDPMCGSGTLVIEAALMAGDIAPGLRRGRFGFHAWRDFDATLWGDLIAAAEARRAAGIASLPRLEGRDRDPDAIAISRANAEAAGLGEQLRFARGDLSDLGPRGPSGLVIANPPYGERLGGAQDLVATYRELGAAIKRQCPGWRAAIITADPELGHALGLKAERRYRFYNGALASQLLVCQVHTAEQAQAARACHEARAEQHRAGIAMLVNRLRKNRRRLAPWLEREGIQCYRLYDADLPEYAVAIDCYGDAVHVQEYAPPASVAEATARRRLGEVAAAVAEVLQPDSRLVFTKRRERQSGASQYQPLGAGGGAGVFRVREGSAVFEVDLASYLDTGLFLDHRPVRRLIAGMAAGTRFLNLFCYTATATVQAVLAGAAESMSIDLSNTYLDWALRNFRYNGIAGEHHRLLRADCLAWLATAGRDHAEAFDLILLDPPTFSNSKKMTGVLDVQRDHAGLIRACMGLLTPGGTLIFSNNFRRFQLDEEIAREFAVENLAARTLDPDFRSDARAHHCWRIRQRSPA